MDLPSLDLKEFFEGLKGQPVYLTFTILSSVFIVFSIIYDRYILVGILIFFYSIAGFFWRMLIKDLREFLPNRNVPVTIFYHVVNFLIIVALGYFLMSSL